MRRFIDRISNTQLINNDIIFTKEILLSHLINNFVVMKKENINLNMRHSFCEIFKMLFEVIYNFHDFDDGNIIYSILNKLYKNTYYKNLFLDCIFKYNISQTSMNILINDTKNKQLSKLFQEIFFIVHFIYKFDIDIDYEFLHYWFNKYNNKRFDFEKAYDTIKSVAYHISVKKYQDEDYYYIFTNEDFMSPQDTKEIEHYHNKYDYDDEYEDFDYYFEEHYDLYDYLIDTRP